MRSFQFVICPLWNVPVMLMSEENNMAVSRQRCNNAWWAFLVSHCRVALSSSSAYLLFSLVVLPSKPSSPTSIFEALVLYPCFFHCVLFVLPTSSPQAKLNPPPTHPTHLLCACFKEISKARVREGALAKWIYLCASPPIIPISPLKENVTT